MTEKPKPRVFISHISEEKAIGAVLKSWLEDVFPGQVSVYLSSDPKDLPGGRRWLNEIEEQLRHERTVCVISVLSPTSVKRAWILLEFGGAWIKDIRAFPFCHSGLQPGDLERPLGDFQGASIDLPNVGQLIVGAVADAVQLQYPTKFDFAGFRAALVRAVADLPPVPETAVPEDVRALVLSKEEETLLRLLADYKRKSPSAHYLRSRFMASRAGIDFNECELALEALERHDLVTTQLRIGEGKFYAISNEGYKLLKSLGVA